MRRRPDSVVKFPLLGDAPATPARDAPLMAQSSTAVITRIVNELVNRGQFASFDELIDADIVSHDPVEPAPIRGGDAYRVSMESIRAGLADLHVTIDDVVADGNKVAYRWTATGCHVGELLGVAPTGTHVTFTGMDIAHVRDGRVVEEWMNWDVLGLLRQLGAQK
jgi:steroid delta-isomerase-like uncharacterized protein